MDRPVLEVVRVGASGPACSETFGPQPVGEPGHVAVAVERVGDQVEGFEGDQRIEGSRGHALDPIRVQGQALQVHQAVEQLAVDVADPVVREDSGGNRSTHTERRCRRGPASSMDSFATGTTYISSMELAPSKAPSSTDSMRFRLRSRLCS